MNDPWDVKSVRQPGHYISCLKLNGVPLLPPVLSKECRKEMQYYKLLAKEVEKRILQLKAYIGESDEDSAQDKTDAPDLLHEYEQDSEPLREVIQGELDVISSAIREEKLADSPSDRTGTDSPELCDSVSTNSNVSNSWPKFLVDHSLKPNPGDKSIIKIIDNSLLHTPQPTDPPERDYNTTPKKNTAIQVDKELLTSNLTSSPDHKNPRKEKNDLFSIEFDISKVEPLLSDPFPDMTMVDGPSSLGSKSFTGSLNNIHSESVKEASTLVRQSSYTVLNPSPLLLAHLKVQSLSTGVEVTSISMSDSLSNLGTPKKRRSWDLESAKIKWSSMAHELKQKTSANTKASDANRNFSRSVVKKPQSSSPTRSKSLQEKPRRSSLPGKSFPKSEPTPRIKRNTSPTSTISNFTNGREQVSKTTKQKSNQPSPNRKLISECEDPATKVKELYDKIQTQQLMQMAHLVEKQKREQMLLQQVFEEQNSILYRQLKTICPKSPIEAKAAWGHKSPQNVDRGDRGPVSLSQLINHTTPERSDGSAASTLTDTHNNLSKCAAILKKSKDITGSLKKHKVASKPQSPTSPGGSRTRTHSPSGMRQRTSRKLSYDTSASSERDHEPVLTDRTNDTLAGLNVTFPSDSDECAAPARLPRAARAPHAPHSPHTPHAPHAARPAPARRPAPHRLPPTPAQLAAASTIVAHAKGYLVRRLLRTERVQATVQTIKDALLCALQLHQDRAGIRGADVDLHRRLIQQITAACYSLHDTFVASSPSERCALIAADRERQRQKPLVRHYRPKTDVMSQSHSGAFPVRATRSAGAHALMTQSNYETFSGTQLAGRSSPPRRRRAWR